MIMKHVVIDLNTEEYLQPNGKFAASDLHEAYHYTLEMEAKAAAHQLSLEASNDERSLSVVSVECPPPVKIRYCLGVRKITPCEVYWSQVDERPEGQYVLKAYDEEAKVMCHFAMEDIEEWGL